MSYRVLGLLAVLALAGCNPPVASQVTLQEKVLPHPNPTTYDFDASIGEVRAAIRKEHEDWGQEMSIKYGNKTWGGDGDVASRQLYTRRLQMIGSESLVWKGDADSLARGLLTRPGNEDDAYLLGMEAPYSESQVYFQGGQPLIYHADFHIHLALLGSGRTRVEITTYDSRVAAGVDRSPTVHFSGSSLFTVAVAPTTVEEYQILRGIGQRLGVTNMPPLVTPRPDSSVRQVVKARNT